MFFTAVTKYRRDWKESKHAYQLACETAMNIDFSELFSLKHIYVKYRNAILSLIVSFSVLLSHIKGLGIWSNTFPAI